MDGALRSSTLKQIAEVSGIGLFSGLPTRLRLCPAAAGAGIAFRRTDLPNLPIIPASWKFASCSDPASRCTALADSGVEIHTIEHVMAALAGMGITDVLIELYGPEVPGLDGSAAPFVDAIQRAGFTVNGGGMSARHIETAAVVNDGRARIELEPMPRDRLVLEYHLDYGPSAPIPVQTARLELRPGDGVCRDFVEGIAPARTFCLQVEALAMQKMGLFAHLSTREMLVIGPAGPIDNQYLFPDEPARHKLLDLLGDLWLAGPIVSGSVRAFRSGHALNRKAAAVIAGSC